MVFGGDDERNKKYGKEMVSTKKQADEEEGMERNCIIC